VSSHNNSEIKEKRSSIVFLPSHSPSFYTFCLGNANDRRKGVERVAASSAISSEESGRGRGSQGIEIKEHSHNKREDDFQGCFSKLSRRCGEMTPQSDSVEMEI